MAPDRDIGVQLSGDLAGARLNAVALTNGVVDGGSSDVDSKDAKEVTGRIVARPWSRAEHHPLRGLGVAVAANSGTHAALPSFFTASWSPQAFYYHGPFGGYAEYVRSSGTIAKVGVSSSIDHDAWQVTGSWVLTGEAASERRVDPRVNFDPASGHIGALQVVARLEHLAVSRDAISLGLAAPGASRTADVWTTGLNWSFNPSIKWKIGFSRTVFDGAANGPRHAENLVSGRAQLAF